MFSASFSSLRRTLEDVYKHKEIDLRAKLERSEYTVAELKVELKEEKETKDQVRQELKNTAENLRKEEQQKCELRQVKFFLFQKKVT
jgi:septal ring factor EnvC (AmiA/AmiB activator)